MMRYRFVASLFSLSVLVLLCGCKTDPLARAYNLTFHLSDELHGSDGTYPSVDVFVKGVTDTERRQTWDNKQDVDDYVTHMEQADDFDLGKQRAVVRLGGNDESPDKTLASNNLAWEKWARTNSDYIVIISNFPRAKAQASGPDKRLLILPLDRKLYTGDKLRVDVTADGLNLRTPPMMAR